MRRSVLLAVMLVPCLTLGAAASEDVTGRLGLGSVVHEVRRGALRYLALERGGIAVIDAEDSTTPRLVTTLLEGRQVVHLALDGDQLIATELRQEELVVRLSLADPRHPMPRPGVVFRTPTRSEPAPPAPAMAPAHVAPGAAGPVAVARILEVKGGRVIFDAGTAAGFSKGARVRVISQQLVSKPDLSGEGAVLVPSGEVTAVLAIEQADERRGMAALGRGDVAAPGDLLERTEEALSERLALPRRTPFTWRAGFLVRPFLGLNSGSKPVGILADGYVSYTFARLPMTLGAAFEPLGVAINAADRHYPMTITATAAYTTDYFEIGLGAGGLVGNAGPCQPGVDRTGQPVSVCESNTGFTINQTLRLGALDGLHFEWRSSVFSRPNGFVFGMGRAEAAVPLTSRLSLFGAGGGGENGWAFGELGVRTFISGVGAPGTVIFSASLGGAGIFDGTLPVNGALYELVAGPSVAFGAEWRL